MIKLNRAGADNIRNVQLCVGYEPEIYRCRKEAGVPLHTTKHLPRLGFCSQVQQPRRNADNVRAFRNIGVQSL